MLGLAKYWSWENLSGHRLCRQALPLILITWLYLVLGTRVSWVLPRAADHRWLMEAKALCGQKSHTRETANGEGRSQGRILSFGKATDNVPPST